MIEEELIVATDFSGLGSFEEALKNLQVKHRIAFACDKDKYVKASYLANHTPEIFYDNIVTRNQKTAPDSDMYVFGFPCQTFSIAGHRKGFEDTRGTLVHNSASYIKEKQPRCFLAENVKGLLSHDKPKNSKSKYGRTFGVIRDLFGKTVNGQQNLYKYDDCLDYHIYFQVLNSKDYGIPQNRERIFIIGFRDEEDAVRFKFPKKFPLKFKLKDLLETEEVDAKYYLSETALKRIVKTPNYLPQVNPDITETINTKNNSGHQLSRDNGTTLIVTNNHGQRLENDIFNCIDANYQKGMDNHGQRPLIFISKEVRSEEGKSIRKENLKKGVDYNPQRAKDIIFEDKDFVNTITTGQTKDNLLMIAEATEKGFSLAEAYDSINLSQPGSKTRRGRIGNQIANTLDTGCKQGVLIPLFGTEQNGRATRIYDSEGIAVTQSANGGGGGEKTGLYLIGFKVRRLTPKEVFRLFGYSDQFFEICKALNSDTQLYKQGGNSIVVKTMMCILIELCKALNIKFKLPQNG